MMQTLAFILSLLMLGFVLLTMLWHLSATDYYSKQFRIIRKQDKYYIEQIVVTTYLFFFKNYKYEPVCFFETETEAYDFVVKKEAEHEVIYQTKNLIK
jgi:hypothetical protein